jgi:aryl carrier-like protein
MTSGWTFPKTATGKVQKNELRDRVAKHLQQQDKESPSANESQVETLANLWAKVLGINVSQLIPETSVHQYADSLVLSRFSAKLRRSTGQKLTLQQHLENPTIGEQSRLLESSTSEQKEHYSTLLPNHDGPPEARDMAYAMASSEVFKDTKKMSQDVLVTLGLTWEDVEDVIPMHDAMERLLKRRRPQSNNHRHGWLCRNATISQVQAALKGSLISSYHAINGGSSQEQLASSCNHSPYRHILVASHQGSRSCGKQE